MDKLIVFLCLGSVALISGCGKSDKEINILVEDSYNQGWWDGMDCVRSTGGSARYAANYCEDK